MATAKRALLATFGTLGDIYPFVAVALALEARGFAATIAAPDMHRAAIEREGLAFVRLRPNETDIARALGVDIAGAFAIMLKNPYFILDEIYLRFLAETYDDVLRASGSADVVVTHSLLVGAHQAAETCGLPCARVALAPLHLQSALAPSLTPPAPYILEPRSHAAILANRIVRSIVRRSVNARLRRLRAFRKNVGLPPTREDFFLDFGRGNKAGAVFGLFSPHFAPPQPDQPSNLSVPGFPFFTPKDPRRRDLDGALTAFLRAGAPPIIFTLGSFAPEVSDAFYDDSIQAARALGLRAVLLAGTKDAARLAAHAGPDEYVCDHAPHSLLFPAGLCVVHHGGIGTTAEALRAGKPQIVVPFFGDQPDNAARIKRLGLGLATKLSAYDARGATLLLRQLLAGDYAKKAREFADLIASEPGAEAIADWAERVTARSADQNPPLPKAREGNHAQHGGGGRLCPDGPVR